MKNFLKNKIPFSNKILQFLYILLLFEAILIISSEKDPSKKNEIETHATNMYIKMSLEDMVDSALETHQISCSSKTSVFLFFDSVKNMCIMVCIFKLFLYI